MRWRVSKSGDGSSADDSRSCRRADVTFFHLQVRLLNVPTPLLRLRFAQDGRRLAPLFHPSVLRAHPSIPAPALTCVCPPADPRAAKLPSRFLGLGFPVPPRGCFPDQQPSSASPSVLIPRKYAALNLRFSHGETAAVWISSSFHPPSTNFTCFMVHPAAEHPVPSLLQTVSRCFPPPA